MLTRPFVLASNDDSARNLTALMVARNDPGSYGKLSQVVMVTKDADGKVEQQHQGGRPAAGQPEDGRPTRPCPPTSHWWAGPDPGCSSATCSSCPSRTRLLYLRPVYAKEESSGRYTLKKVAVTSGDSVGFGDTRGPGPGRPPRTATRRAPPASPRSTATGRPTRRRPPPPCRWARTGGVRPNCWPRPTPSSPRPTRSSGPGTWAGTRPPSPRPGSWCSRPTPPSRRSPPRRRPPRRRPPRRETRPPPRPPSPAVGRT